MMADVTVIKNVGDEYADYLRDESRMVGQADSIVFPKSERDLRSMLAEASRAGSPVTIQGARTGITGGAVPRGGQVINLSRMDRVLGLRYDEAAGTFFLTVQPGVLLAELRKAIAARQFDTTGWSAASQQALGKLQAAPPQFFPPDPTETGASVGGMIACNASGACSYFYGSTRRHVERLRLITVDGSVLHLRRGTDKARGRDFVLCTEHGAAMGESLPAYSMPAVKNASGYYAAENMDMVDLFIGSEGTLAVVAEAELRLSPAPAVVWGVMMFFGAEPDAVKFVRKLRASEARPVAIEFFDHGALNLLRRQKAENPAFQELPSMPAEWHTAIYAEFHGQADANVEAAVELASGILTECGGKDDATWLASDDRERERLRFFRHAVPESVNLLIDLRRKVDPSLTKLGTDLAVPDKELEKILRMYRTELDEAKLEYVIFGHIGNNHVHVNILPRSPAEYDAGKKLYLAWAQKVVQLNGTVSAEHGIGKLKTAMLREMYGEDGIRQMQAVKRAFDPYNLLNPGNLFG
jgi:D-lactate dehydrogenase (cytochrome)